ncbi:hypothetical protein QTP88_022444 [Uroleucon formosanum]
MQDYLKSLLSLKPIYRKTKMLNLSTRSNVNVERIFSDRNNLWTDDKSRLDVKTVKNMLVVKHYFTENCSEFHDFLLGNKKLLKQIHTSEKYLQRVENYNNK